jgi:hypothetical protein
MIADYIPHVASAASAAAGSALSRYTVGRFTPVALAICAMLVVPFPSMSRTAANCARVNAGLRPRYGESSRPSSRPLALDPVAEFLHGCSLARRCAPSGRESRGMKV